MKIIFQQFLFPAVFCLIGVLAVLYFGFKPFNHSSLIHLTSLILLGIAIFSNVSGIDQEFVNKNKQQIFSLVILGVIYKAAIIGSVGFLLTGEKVYFVIGGILAQIDPVLTSYVIEKLNVSEKVKQISKIESSFDDLFSIIWTSFILFPAVFGIYSTFGSSVTILLIFIFAFVFILAHKFLLPDKGFIGSSSVIVNAICNTTMATAFVAWYLRMDEKIFHKTIPLVTALSYIIIGFYFPSGFDLNNLYMGVFIAFVLVYIARRSQVYLFLSNYNKKDKAFLASNQQQGLTSIVLLISAVPIFGTELVGIVIPAMLTVNILFYINNAYNLWKFNT